MGLPTRLAILTAKLLLVIIATLGPLHSGLYRVVERWSLNTV